MTSQLRLCGAARRSGGTCTQPIGRAAVRCRFHGGASPQAKAARQQRLAEAEAAKAIKEAPRLNRPAVEVLQELAAEALAFKDALAERVAQLEELRYRGASGEQLRGELQAYTAALDRAEGFVHRLARLGLDERQVKLDEARVVLLVSVLERVLADPQLGLDSRRQALGRELLATALEAGE